MPNFDDAEINRQGDIGRRIGNDPASILPPLSGWGQVNPTGKDVLLSALMGLGPAVKAANEAAQFGDPFSAVLAGIGGAATQPGPNAVALQRLEQTPLPDDSPIIAKYPEFKGLTLGWVQKLAPLLQRSENMERQLSTFLLAEKGRNDRATQAADAAKERMDAPKALGSEAGIKISLAQDGNSNLSDIRNALASPKARELILKAGGSWKKLSSLGDPEAEALANAIFQVADAEARIKTGAAINNTELDQYFNGLVPKSGTIGGIQDRLNRKQKYFDSVERTLSYGKKVPTQSGTVEMITPDGVTWNVPADKVSAAEKRGARRR